MADPKKEAPSAPSATVPAKPIPFRMPTPPPIVVWRNAPGGEACYAAVTKRNKNSVSLLLWPPDQRVGVPKEGVRHVSDPWNKTQGINADSGVWDYTDESKVLIKLVDESEHVQYPI